MSVLVVGLSYRTAPIGVLERAALDAGACRALEATLVRHDHVAEAIVLSTCNRLEVYVEVSRFHGGVADVGACLSAATGLELTELTDHLYVHYEDAAVAHLFAVACGLDSMAVGEQQILGQVRAALRAAQDGGSVGRTLGVLLQQALRVGKRAHAETGLDRAGHTLVEAGLERAEAIVGPLARARVLVVGAGAMSGLVAATARRLAVGDLTVVNRTPERASRLAASAGGRAVAFEDLATALAAADVVVSCTGAVGHVLTPALVGPALAARASHPRNDGRTHPQPHTRNHTQVYVDLALPRDVDPAVADLDGAHVVDLEVLGHHLAGGRAGAELADARDLVAAEVASYLAARRGEAVAPTVVALRAHARAVVDTELARMQARVGDLDARLRAELEQTVHRVVEKLLHTPTVRVRELAETPGGSVYADALGELFGLDLERVASITAVDAFAPAGSNVSGGSTVSRVSASGGVG